MGVSVRECVLTPVTPQLQENLRTLCLKRASAHLSAADRTLKARGGK